MFSFFSPQRDCENEYEYDDFLRQYVSVVQENPNSEYLLKYVFMAKYLYKSRSDLLTVFRKFSNDIRSTEVGILLEDFINRMPNQDIFEDTELYNYKTNKKELIVQDTSKYNLIIFSASWCAPCHVLIPDLKRIYTDLRKNLILTYVSLDEPDTQKNWKDMIIKDEIMWRSLLVENDLISVRDKYSAFGIPRMILVSPGGKEMHVIDIRDQKDRTLLYKIVSD